MTLNDIVAVARDRGIHPETGLLPYNENYVGESFPRFHPAHVEDHVAIARHWFSERTPITSLEHPQLVEDVQASIRREYSVTIPFGWILTAAAMETFSIARTYPAVSCIAIGRRRPVLPCHGSFRRWARGWALLTNDSVGRLLREIRADDDMPEMNARGNLLRYVQNSPYRAEAGVISELWNRYRRFRGGMP
ncbi:MAG: hypothetical protein QM744_14370 [Mesorhizobium sp.]